MHKQTLRQTASNEPYFLAVFQHLFNKYEKKNLKGRKLILISAKNTTSERKIFTNIHRKVLASMV